MKRIAIAVALLLSAPSFALGELAELSIKDTSGIVRGTADVNGQGVVEFSVTDAAGAPADGSVVTLTNSLTGEVLTATSKEGVVSFADVTPGSWTVASATPGLTFTNISIGAVPSVLAADSTLMQGLAVLGIGGGAAGLAIAINNSGNNSGTEISPVR